MPSRFGRFALVLAAIGGFAFASLGPAHLAEASPVPAAAGSTINLDVAPTLHLGVAAVQPSFRSTAAVALRFVVTNVGRATCALTSLPDGAITVLSEGRDGAALSPTFSPLLLIDGSSALISQHTAQVARGASTSFTVTSTPGHGFEVPALLPDETELLASWPTQKAGEYQFRIVYEVPTLAGSRACAGESNTATVSFKVSAPQSRTWLVPAIAVGVGVGGTLVVVLVVIRWGRGRSRRSGASPWTSAAAVVIMMAATAATVTALAAPARADVVFREYAGSSANASAEYSYCHGQIEKFDPSVFDRFDYPDSPNLYIDAVHETDTHFYGRNSIVNWDPNEHRTFSDGVKAEPCSALYHELVHAEDNADGTLDKGPCGDTGIETDEVVATLAENRYRAAHYMKPRLNYDQNRLPSSLAACKAPKDIFDKILALTNGDPHLTTFDGQRYDFQAVGEFTLVRSKSGDLTIQVRQAELMTSQTVAVNSAVAMKAGGTRLGFYLTDGYIAVYRNQHAVNVAMGSTPLAGGAVLGLSYDPYKGALYQVRWADGTVASVWRAGIWGLVVSVAPAKDRAGTLSGLLGDYDLQPVDGVADKDGRLFTPTFSSLYPRFADSWRLSQATSLFNYPKGTSTATYTDRTFPHRPATAPGLSPAQRRSALLACRAAGITQRVDLADCALDVAVTGSADLATSAAEADQEKVVAGQPTGTAHPGGGVLATTVISKPGTGAHTTFVGRRGQRVLVEVVSTTLPYQCGTLTLHGPDDNVLAEGCTGKGASIDGQLLPSNGVYSIYLHPSGGATGRATLRIFISEDKALPSSIDGAPVTASVTVPGGQTRVTFDAKAGQSIFVEASRATIAGSCGALELEGPQEARLALGCIRGGSGYIDGRTLAVTGQYSVLIDPAGTDTGQVTVRIIGDHDRTIPTTVGGPPVVAQVSQPGATAAVTFFGRAGGNVKVTLSKSTFPAAFVVYFVGPGQSTMKAVLVEDGKGAFPSITLPTTGIYAVEVDPSGTDLGHLTVAVASGR